jgi:hypothetical protein
MKQTLLKQFLLAAIAASGALVSTASLAATQSFSMTYSGAGTSGGSCGTSYDIAGVEPATTGTKYPVFIYMVGTTETYNNGSAMAAVNAMAAKGYVAAAVGYATSQFGNCSVLSAKSSCIFNPGSTASAVSQLCSRGNADCSKGIVVAGFSQGSILGILAKNYDARVQAVYGIGVSNKYSTYDLSSCVSNGNRSLASDRLRAVDGEKDTYAGGNGVSSGTQPAVQSSLTNVTGRTCAAGSYSCLTSNNSGWIIAKNSQVTDGSADHCYMRASGDCFGSQSALDAGWKSGTASWQLDPNLQWLTNFTTK